MVGSKINPKHLTNKISFISDNFSASNAFKFLLLISNLQIAANFFVLKFGDKRAQLRFFVDEGVPHNNLFGGLA